MSERVALLVGASGGIGYAVADLLARSGARIVLASREPHAAAKRIAAAHGVEVVPVACDIADERDVRGCLAAVERLGRLDALLLNHGGPPVKSFMELDDEDWRAAFERIVVGPARLLRACVPRLRDSGGRVVAIASFTVKSPCPGMALSNALRAALVNALKTAALELGGDQILINVVGPGFTATDRAISVNEGQAQRLGTTRDAVDREVLAQIPLGRYGEPEEVAALVAFLLSDANRYVTGQNVLADGGLVTAT